MGLNITTILLKQGWPENPANTYAWHTDTLDDSCFDLIWSHQQCISWSPRLEINSQYNSSPERKNIYIYILAPEVIIITRMRFSNPLGKGTGGDRVLCKEYGCNLQDTFRLISRAITMIVNLASLVCDMDSWLSCRVLALQSVVAGSISSGGDYGIHCWWVLIKSKPLSSVPVCRA